MHEYLAPLADMKFVLRELVDLKLLAQLPGFSDFYLEVADAVLRDGLRLVALSAETEAVLRMRLGTSAEAGTSAESRLREGTEHPGINVRMVTGFGPVMPTFRGQISDQELNEVIAYIESLK